MLAVAPNRQPSAELSAEGEEANPWNRLGYYEKEVMDHLDRSKEQLSRLSKVRARALRSQMSREHGDAFDFEDREHQLRKSLAEKIQCHRNNIENLASLLGEILQHREQGRWNLVGECYKELEKTVGMLREENEEQKRFFLEALAMQKANTMDYSKGLEAARKAKWSYGCITSVCGLALFITAGGLCADSWFISHEKPAEQHWAGSVASRFLGAFLNRLFGSTKEDNFLRTSVLLSPVLPFASGIGGIWSLREFMQSPACEREFLDLKHQMSENTDFIRANEEMWTGMSQLIEALWKKATYFKSLNAGREERITQTLRAIAQKTFNMLMSVDVYMLWMERHNMFPPNVSVSVIMGKQKYHAIHRMLQPSRGWFGFKRE